MKFDELEKVMRGYETAHDDCVPAGTYMVARIDGRGFTRLTKETCAFEAPFDIRFRDLMVETCKHLMNCGFKVIYAYNQSDEISLLFDLHINAFGRKLRKYNSLLAGEASAKFSLMLGQVAAFDCRICQLPTQNLVVDYFRWRNEDANRNALNAHCYWQLRKEGKSQNETTSFIEGKSLAEKEALLHSKDINFKTLPLWQKRGTGLYMLEEEKIGFNPKENKEVISTRKILKTDYELPQGDAYSEFLWQLLKSDAD